MPEMQMKVSTRLRGAGKPKPVMRLRGLMIALALLATLGSDSWGQSKQPTQPNQTSKSYERGTEQSPVIVKMLPTKESEEKATADAHREDEKTANDARLARFTELLFWATGALSIIALFQLFVFGWQGIQLKRTVSAAKAATELGNREFTATHRPRVIVRFIQGPFADEDKRQFVFITFVNIGESSATIKAIGAQLAMRRIDGVWESGVDAEPIDIAPIVLNSGLRHMIKMVAKNPLSEFEMFSDATGESKLCVVGRIEYVDDNGMRRETAFLRTCDDRDNFAPSKNPTEEYQD
jgi:hypothetical protein